MNEIKAELRKLRMVRAYLIGSLLASVSLVEITFNRAGSRWSSWHSLVAGLALVCVLEGFNFRHRYLAPAAALLAKNTGDAKALKRWAGWQVICLVMASAVASYGLVLRVILRCSFRQSVLFYLLGFFLLLLWAPRPPMGEDSLRA